MSYSVPTGARTKLLEAALMLIREKGWSATTVDELCSRAGVTKGAFFHHFKSKTELGVAAAEHWTIITSALFRDAPYHQHDDPIERLLDYVAFRRELVTGCFSEFTCLAGTMLQEVHASAPEIRSACAESILGHAETLEADCQLALTQSGASGVSAKSLAHHTQTVIQGAFIMAKATGDPNTAREAIDHLDRYLRLLFFSTPP